MLVTLLQDYPSVKIHSVYKVLAERFSVILLVYLSYDIQTFSEEGVQLLANMQETLICKMSQCMS